MSLEIALQENTKALVALTAAIAAMPAGAPAVANTVYQPATTPAPVAPVVAAAPVATTPAGAPLAPVAPAKNVEPAAAPAPTASTPPTATTPAAPAPKAENSAANKAGYEECAALLTQLVAAKGRDIIVETLAKFGATNLSGVDPARYGELRDAFNMALLA